MNKRKAILASVAWLALVSGTWADTVKLASGTVMGKVTAMSSTEVTVEQTVGGTKTIPVNDIELIHYEGEMPPLKTARTAIAAGRYEDALALLQKVKESEGMRPEIKQDLDFYKALAAAKLALAGSGEIQEAGKAMAAFVASQPKSYHYLVACEVVGDLLVASNKQSLAQKYYGELAKAPWPDYQMRAGVAMGRAWLVEGKFDEANRAFQTVIDSAASGETANRQRFAATLGKGRGLVALGKADEAIGLVQGIIDKSEPLTDELYAKAYNTLGLAYRKAGRSKEALLAFLHTDLLYSTSREDHVEALRNLVELWNALQKPDRAAQAQTVLTQQYKQGEPSAREKKK